MQKGVFLIILLTVYSHCLLGQGKNGKQVDNLKERIARLISQLDKTQSLNYVDFGSDESECKQDTWIESTNGEIWFIDYRDGERHGTIVSYYISNGNKHLEGTYKNGNLFGTLKIYDPQGALLKSYENIELNTMWVERSQLPSAWHYKLKEKKHLFKYRAYVQRYSSLGEASTAGVGLFDDSNLFEHVIVGKWGGLE